MSYKVLTQCFCSWPLANVYALHVICGCSQERMCRIAFIFWHYELHESYFNASSRLAIKKNLILLEFYKQEFKQGWFMLLLLTFYNEETNIRSQTRLLLPNKSIRYRYDENFFYCCAQLFLTENIQTVNRFQLSFSQKFWCWFQRKEGETQMWRTVHRVKST